MTALSVLSVADLSVWAEIERVVPLAAHVESERSPLERVVRESFDREGVPALIRAGIPVSIRRARRTEAAVAAAREAEEGVVARLSRPARRVLASAWRHAEDGQVVAGHAWDPEGDAEIVRELLGAGVLAAAPEDPARFRLHPDLPPPPEVPLDLDDAVMDETDDLPPPNPGPLGLLHDLASLAAAIDHEHPKRTQGGTVARNDARRLGQRLASAALTSSGALEADDRWGRALRALEALGAVSLDPVGRELHIDLGLEDVLAGEAPDAIDRLVRKLIEPDLRPALGPLREALRQARDGALDEVVLLELLREQHREILVAPWTRHGVQVYPSLPGEALRIYDDQGFEALEARLLRRLLGRLERLGLVRRAPGVVAATADGRIWARARTLPSPPVWVTGDLEVVVPPDGVTPWERFQLERLGRCLARDVVDRYRLERAGLVAWLAVHELDEALALLRRRCPGVPSGVVAALEAWARSASRVVLTRGVRVD